VLAIGLLFSLAACTGTPAQPPSSPGSAQPSTPEPTYTDLVGHCPDDVINTFALPMASDFKALQDAGGQTEAKQGGPADVAPAELSGLVMGCVVVMTATVPRTPSAEDPNDHTDQQWIWAVLHPGTKGEAVADVLKPQGYEQPFPEPTFFSYKNKDTFTVTRVQLTKTALPEDAFPGCDTVIVINTSVG